MYSINDAHSQLVFQGIVWGIALIVMVFYAVEMARCINLPGTEKRLFSGWWALLTVPPYIGVVANFVIVWAADKSLRMESDARGIPPPNDGLWMGILMSVLVALITFPDLVGLRFSIASALGALVFWILWWRWAYKQRGRIEDAPTEQAEERREPTISL